METFNLKLDEQNYQINVIEPMDKYGEDNKTHFSEIPLVEFKAEDGKVTRYDVADVLNTESEIIISSSDKPVSLENRKEINDKLFEAFPGNYLKIFANLGKHRKPKF
jgi:hypothetical protein